jgi:hypothetical protein
MTASLISRHDEHSRILGSDRGGNDKRRNVSGVEIELKAPCAVIMFFRLNCGEGEHASGDVIEIKRLISAAWWNTARQKREEQTRTTNSSVKQIAIYSVTVHPMLSRALEASEADGCGFDMWLVLPTQRHLANRTQPSYGWFQIVIGGPGNVTFS